MYTARDDYTAQSTHTDVCLQSRCFYYWRIHYLLAATTPLSFQDFRLLAEVEVEDEVNLRLTFSRPICLGVRDPRPRPIFLSP
jgi:hypothetical protein